MWYDPTGGEGFGPRFLVAAIPFLLLPAGAVLQGASRRLWAFAFALYAIGAVMNGIAGLTEAVTPMFNYATWPFLSWTLPMFLRVGPDTWWLRYAGGDWVVPSVIVIGAALVFPVVSSYLLTAKETLMPGERPS
jgi:hypothetical protein